MVDLRDGNHCECCRASWKSFALEQVGKPSGKEKTNINVGRGCLHKVSNYILSVLMSYIFFVAVLKMQMRLGMNWRDGYSSSQMRREEMRREKRSEDDHQANAERKEFCLRTSRRDMKHGSQVDIQPACNL